MKTSQAEKPLTVVMSFQFFHDYVIVVPVTSGAVGDLLPVFGKDGSRLHALTDSDLRFLEQRRLPADDCRHPTYKRSVRRRLDPAEISGYAYPCISFLHGRPKNR